MFFTFSRLHPFTFDAMASWYSTRSRSRTTSRPRARGVGSSSPPSTRASRPEYDNTIPRREPTSYRTLNDRHASWRYPDRHVLIIINFQDLADLSSRTHQLPDNADLLDAECRIHLDAIDEVSLFTWCRHFDHREVIQIPIGNLCHLISTRIRDTWDVRIPGATLENYVARIIGEKRFNLLLTKPLPRPSTLGCLAGATSNIPQPHGKRSPNLPDAPLFGAYPVVATFLESSCLDNTTAA